MIKQSFLQLVSHYTNDRNVQGELWTEIEKNYSSKKRYYHSLQHLEHLLLQLIEIKNKLRSWDTVLFSLYYHDIVYNSLKSDNEERSADLAEKRMKQMAVPAEVIAQCKAQILATKSHTQSTDSDTNYFTDADLSILGQSWEIYIEYCKSVRKEYSIYPDMIYNPGRKKVLRHFLTMERIFKTDFFYSKFEEQAKRNLRQELQIL